jgi:hypothetical protein
VQLLGGLPRLKHLAIQAAAAASSSGSPASSLRAFPSSLTALQLGLAGSIELDAGALAAACGGLQSLELLVCDRASIIRGAISLAALTALTSLERAEVVDFSSAQDDYCHGASSCTTSCCTHAAGVLTRLHHLALPRAMVPKP